MNKSMKLKVVGVIFLALGIVGLQLNPNRQEENLFLKIIKKKYFIPVLLMAY